MTPYYSVEVIFKKSQCNLWSSSHLELFFFLNTLLLAKTVLFSLNQHQSISLFFQNNFTKMAWDPVVCWFLKMLFYNKLMTLLLTAWGFKPMTSHDDCNYWHLNWWNCSLIGRARAVEKLKIVINLSLMKIKLFWDHVCDCTNLYFSKTLTFIK